MLIIGSNKNNLVYSTSIWKKVGVLSRGMRPLGRPNRKWEENIRMEIKEIGINTRNWVDTTQDRDYWRALVNAVLNLWVP